MSSPLERPTKHVMVFHTYVSYRIVSFRFPCGKHLCIQKSNCWTDRTICLNKTDANVGECVRAYIHAYVQMITMCVWVAKTTEKTNNSWMSSKRNVFYGRWTMIRIGVFSLSLSILQPCVFGLPLTTGPGMCAWAIDLCELRLVHLYCYINTWFLSINTPVSDQ